MASSNHSLEESIDRCSEQALQWMLESCQAICRSLQDRVSALEENYSDKKMLLGNHQFDARIYEGALKSCVKDKAAVASECAKLENEMIKLKMAREQSGKEPTSIKKSRASRKKSKDLKGN